VHAFDSVCADVVRSPLEYNDLWYVLATLGTIAIVFGLQMSFAIVVGLLRNMVCLQKKFY